MPNHSGPMACPVDGATLVMSERAGIEIDYCPSCRGVWLDRGELDKIIERGSAQPVQQAAPAQQSAPAAQSHQPQMWSQPQANYGQRPHKRRKSFLEELFD